MATGANRTPLGRLNPAMSKKKSGTPGRGDSPGGPSLLSQHRQQPQAYRNEHQPPLPQNPPPPQHMPHQPYYPQGSQQYMHQPPLPTMQMQQQQQPPLPPQSNMYHPQPPPPQNQPPPPPPPQQPSMKPPMPMANDESHQQMLDYMQRIPQQRASEKAKDASGDQPVKKRKKRSRWGDTEERTKIPGMPVALPSHLTPDQQKQYLLHFQIEEISIKLRSGNLGIPENPDDRSPSPEPIYNSEGKRLNTREFRVRKNLEEERHALIQEAYALNQEYKPPPDYKPPSTKIQDKVMIPQDKNPTINFIGLLIGPRGNTLKKMEKDTGCKIIIRGKGSVKEGKGRPGGPLPGEDEPLHALVTGPSHLDVKKALDVIRKIIKEGIECPESANELRRMQLRELAALNGTLIEEDMVRCRNCGGTDHRHWECTEQKNVTNMVVCTKCGGYGHVENDCVYQIETGEAVTQTFEDKVKMDEEYMSLMAELQGGDPNAAASAAKNAQAMGMPNKPSVSIPAIYNQDPGMRQAGKTYEENQSRHIDNNVSGPPPIPVSAPWNAPPNPSNPPPSLLGNPPNHQQPNNRLPRPVPRPAPLMSTNSPQPLMSSGPIGMRPSSQPPPWASNNQTRGNAPPPLANFGNRGGPPNQHSGRMPMPNMQMRMQSPPVRGMNQPLQPPPPPPPGVSPQQPATPVKPQNAPNQSGSSWDAVTPPRWQMGQQTSVGYMMPNMNPYGAAPPPPPPGPSAPAPALPPWATAPPPPPPPPPS